MRAVILCVGFVISLFFSLLSVAMAADFDSDLESLKKMSVEKRSEAQKQTNFDKKKNSFQAVLVKTNQIKEGLLSDSSKEGSVAEDPLFRFALLLENLDSIKRQTADKRCLRIKYEIERDFIKSWEYQEAQEWLTILCPKK